MTEEIRETLAAVSDELADAVERAGQAVVAVHGRPRLPASGIVWPGGVVVTADHVLTRDDEIAVTLADGQTVPATLAGRDPGSDLAVLRLANVQPTPATLAPPRTVRVGHFILALGRPGTPTPMASFGIVSALGGTWRTARGGVVDGYIRADLVLYPGFSGGPLIDTQGRVVGLNSSHLARGQAIAIPTSAVETIVQLLLTQGHIRRAYLGISSQPVRLPAALRQRLGLQQETGLMIVGVEPGTPADRAGLLLGDILIAVDGRTIADAEDLQMVLGPALVGQPITVTVIRGGERQEIGVTPAERK